MRTGRARAAGPRRGQGRGPWVAVVGTRPNYVKVAPLIRAAARRGRELLWIDTGQHTDAALTRLMARDLGVPPPLARVRGRARSQGRIAHLSERLAAHYRRVAPSLVVALGDVDSTLAAGLAAWRLDLPLVHVEAGLRSYEREMPEERNRVCVDHISDRLYLTEASARENLRAEGIPRARQRLPGNVMADALREARPLIEAAAARIEDLPTEAFGVVTLHRQANVDDPRRLQAYVDSFCRLARERPLWFPVHPRTEARLAALGERDRLEAAGVRLLAPLPYLAFLGLVSRAAVVVTDSGGLQVEAALLGTPCVTARRRTEHPLTLSHGGNVLAGSDPRRLAAAVRRAWGSAAFPTRRPRAWDGHAADRIVEDWCKGFERPGRLPEPLARLWQGL
jgi:UDP-N-acetylglucosamine 2-epimerase (non-hydrolysing)